MRKPVVLARAVGRFLLVFALAQATFLACVLQGTGAPPATWHWCMVLPMVTAAIALTFLFQNDIPDKPSTKD